MADKRTDLPSPKSPNFEQRLRETVMTYLGRQGDALDRGITVRDLFELGLARFKTGSKQLEIGDGVPGGGGGGGGGGVITPPPDPYEPDLTPPPTPTGFDISAGIEYVFISHDAPLYTVGHGHARTRVYGLTVPAGNPLPTFGDAIELGTFEGTFWAMSSPPNTTWHLWIKWESVDGVLSVDPAGGTNGLSTTTGVDVELLLSALTGQITESQLYSSLGARIDLIDGSGPGSVNARVAAETVARQTEDGKLYAQYTVKVDVAGHVSGFGLASEANVSETPRSQFGIRADRFWVAPPTINSPTAPTSNLYVGMVWNDTSQNPAITKYYNGSTWQTTPVGNVPFVVQTSPTTINGVEVPPGVYMDAAYIKNGTITNAKIGNAAIDDAKIANLSASKIIAGSVQVGQYIQSATYIANTQGWRISGDGNVEFSSAYLRGSLAVGSFVQSTNFVQGVSGWRIKADGTAEFGAASIRGLLTAAQIDTRGLTIKDASGNIIFGSGATVSPSSYMNVPSTWLNSSITVNANGTLNGAGSGQVTLAGMGYTGAFDATRNTIHSGSSVPSAGLGNNGDLYYQWGQVNGANWWTKIDGVWYLASTQGAVLDPASGAAVKGQITTGNISTFIASAAIGEAYIANAAITNAKIADLAVSTGKIQNLSVDTLKIQDAAVTVPTSAQATSTILTNDWHDLISANLTVPAGTANNAKAIVVAMVVAQPPYAQNNTVTGGGDSGYEYWYQTWWGSMSFQLTCYSSVYGFLWGVMDLLDVFCLDGTAQSQSYVSYPNPGNPIVPNFQAIPLTATFNLANFGPVTGTYTFYLRTMRGTGSGYFLLSGTKGTVKTRSIAVFLGKK